MFLGADDQEFDMYLIIFEVYPHNDQKNRYFELAAQLRQTLHEQPGFIHVERFQSLVNEGKILSLSCWESDDAIAKWRHHGDPMVVQEEGKRSVFKSYRLRVAEVVRDYEFSSLPEVTLDAAR